MFTKYSQVRISYFAEETSITEQVKFVILLLHATMVSIQKTKWHHETICGITTKPVYCSTLCVMRPLPSAHHHYNFVMSTA